MIEKLTGILDTLLQNSVILDVQGVGYGVQVSAKTLTELPPVGQKVSLWIEHILRQDHQQLCGFYGWEERHCFQALLNVQGVGVRVALAILSALTPDELKIAIARQDRLALTQAEGVGAKIAGRIVLELKDKLLTGAATSTADVVLPSPSMEDVVAGLISLGYSRAEASTALSKTLKDNPTHTAPEVLIRLSLQKLAKAS